MTSRSVAVITVYHGRPAIDVPLPYSRIAILAAIASHLPSSGQQGSKVNEMRWKIEAGLPVGQAVG